MGENFIKLIDARFYEFSQRLSCFNLKISGEVALPGGKAEEGDADDATTALREAKEEIGLDPSLVTVVASLEHFLSKVQCVLVPAYTPAENLLTVEKLCLSASRQRVWNFIFLFLRLWNQTHAWSCS